jgi:GNAT superfamily N-acetyltransferase
MTPKDATMLLSQMGLASVPTWIRPFNVLSNGEQYRASLAKAVCDANDGNIIFVDEYTSVVDRNVAMSMSNALQKYIRRTNKKIILATCHYDIFEWLRPDWIYDLNKGGALEKGDYLRRPQIELQVYRTTCDTWDRFKKYHYMTAELNEAATCFVFTWNEKLVAFESILPLPNGSYKNAYREHRLVVLPDFQGLGLGIKISEWCGGILLNDGKTFYTKTVNPALGIYRQNSANWHQTGKYMKSEKAERCEKSYNMMGGLTRLSFCHKYVGEPINGFEDLLLPIDKIRYNISMKGQLTFNFG